MPFIINQSVGAVAGVNSQAELLTALAGSDSIISLGANFSTTSQITISRTVEIKGNGHTISSAFAKTDNSNNSVIGIQGVTNTVTLSNLIIEGKDGVNLHGVNAYVSNAVLNDVTIRNNDNTAININGSEVVVNNLKTSGHKASLSFGIIDLATGSGVTRSPKLTVNGRSEHAESGNFHIKRLSGTVIDTNSQYNGPTNTLFWGYRYTLKSAPAVPTISSPAESQEITTTSTTVTWNAVVGASTYNVKLNGVVIANGLSTNSYNLSGLADGVSHKVEVQSVAASGLTSGWSATRTFKVADITPPAAPVITNSPVYVNASESNDQATWSHNGNDVDHFEYREYRNLDDANADTAYWTQVRTASERSQTVGQSWTSNITLYYRVVAVDAAGNRSALSELGTVIIDKSAPNISWQKQPDALYGNGAGFHVRPITSEVGTTKSVYIDSTAPENLVWTLTSDHKNFDTKNSNNQTLWDKLSDGEHKFVAVFKDAAGNETQSSSNVFVVDRTAPIVKITSPSIGDVKSGEITVTGTATDETSGISEVTVHLRKVKSNGKLDGFLTSITVPVVDGKYSTTIDSSLYGDGLYGVTVIGNDKAGNQNVGGGTHLKSFTIDNTKPVGTADLADIVRGNVSITQIIKDDNPASGKLRIWKLKADGTQDNDKFFAIGDLPVDSGGKIVYSLDTTKLFGDGLYIAKFTATDKAGNADVTVQKQFRVDNTNPTVTIKPESVGSEDSMLFCRVSFKLFDAGNIDKVTINGVEKNLTNNNWSDVNGVKPGAFGGVEGANTLVVYDVVGNTTTLNFTLDCTSPIGKISYSTTGWTNGSVTATLTTDEPVNTPDGWSRVSDTEFTKKYSSNLVEPVVLTDFAGNQSTLNVSINNIDKIKPAVSVDNLILDSTSKTLTAVFGATDSQSGIKSTSFAVYDTADKSGKKLIANSSANGEISIDISTLSNGTYYLHVFAEDNAGNMTGDNSSPLAYAFKVDRNQNNGDGDEGQTGTGPAGNESNNSNRPTALSPVVNNTAGTVARTSANTANNSNVNTTQSTDQTEANTQSTADSTRDDTAVLGTEDSKTNTGNSKWSVVNLVLAALTALLSVIALAGIVTKSKGDKKSSIIRAITLIPAISAAVAFFLIENLSLAMGWFNTWTILFAGIAILQIVLLTNTKRS